MYHPAIIAARREALLQQPAVRALYPDGQIPEYTIADARQLTTQIHRTRDPESGAVLRPLTPEEDRFAAAATLRALYDAPFFLEVFCWIDAEGRGIRPLYPLWESQRFVLQRLATLEYQHAQTGSLDGLLVNVLKARQLGVTSFDMCLGAHRILTQPYIRAICGSDVEEQARYMFKMVERVYDQLPFFLKPEKAVPYAAGREINFVTKSSMKAAWGKTTRGALQAEGGKKGNIERGRTNSVVLISELATWDNPEQLDSALLPGIPVSPQTLVMFESTAELAGDWWHLHWQACQDGTTPRHWSNIFIPWCVEPTKYTLPAPDGWQPSTQTRLVADTIERDLPTWIGEARRLTKAQLYWYESTRAYYTSKNQLHAFLREFPSNPDECFQYAGRSVFTLDELAQIDQAARPLIDVWSVEPSRDIAELKRLPPDDPTADAQRQIDQRRYPPPIAAKPSAVPADVLVPAGYGFRRLTRPEVTDLPSLRHTVLSVYEYPRSRGRRRYILGVDVGDGLGQDYSVISVIREPTIEEPAEEVAQYISNQIRPSQLAYVVDALGHFYCDEDGLEACAAVELNNHGITVQDLLQLHLGYTHFYVWEVVDAADASARFTKRIGWSTTTRTRPILLEKFHDAVTTFDPISLTTPTTPGGLLRPIPDLRLNSPITRQELRYFITEGLMGEAEHAKGQHDDCIFATAIGYYVAYRLSGGEAEPLAERRRRRAQQQARDHEPGGVRRDWRNSSTSSTAAQIGEDDDGDDSLHDDTADLTFFGGRQYE